VTPDQDGRERLSLAEVALRTVVIVAVVVGSALLIILVWDLRRIIVWLLIAVMLALTIAPGVAWLERRHVPRWLGASLITLAAVVVVLAIDVAVAVPLLRQSRELLSNLPHLAHDLLKPGGPLAFVEQHFHVESRIGQITPGRVFHLVAGPRSIASIFSQAAAIVAAAVTIVTITIMLLIEGPRGWKVLVDALGERGRHVDVVGHRMQRSVGGYVRGNLLISLLASIGSFAAMSILGVPYALPLALAVGLLDIIPLIGATLGAVLCVLVALSVGWLAAVLLVVYFVVYQQTENHVLAPVIYAKTVAMSPLIVLLVSLAGAILGGLVGVLLAIPIASAVQIGVGEILRARGVERLADLAERRTEEKPDEGSPLLPSEDEGLSEQASTGATPDEERPAGRVA